MIIKVKIYLPSPLDCIRIRMFAFMFPVFFAIVLMQVNGPDRIGELDAYFFKLAANTRIDNLLDAHVLILILQC